MKQVQIGHLTTENRNPKTMELDRLSTLEVLRIMNEEDQRVPQILAEALPAIDQAVELIIASLKAGGRMIYIGAGTSGRLGVIDAAECMPTFGTTDEVIGILAGGQEAFIVAQEGVEDSAELGEADLKAVNLTANDVVVGIAASGRTPYVLGALAYGNELGAKTVAVACNLDSEIGKVAQVAIEVALGSEVLTGSTRLKSGTAQKLILNMLSTASMVGIGKVYGNLMVDVKVTNLKLLERAKRIVMMATDCDYETASDYLTRANQNAKLAIVMILTGLDVSAANQQLADHHGFIREAIK